MLPMHAGSVRVTALWILLLFTTISSSAHGRHFSGLSLGPDGGYRHGVIAIPEDWPLDWQLVEKIKDWATSFSGQLSQATGPMFPANNASLWLAQIYILLPAAWANSTSGAAAAAAAVATATWQSYERAEIRLAESPTVPPYQTHHDGRCGTVGKRIVFDIGHVITTEDYWLGKQLLGQFAQYRWGVKPEHNGPDGPHFYAKDGRLLPAVCSASTAGTFRHRHSHRPCRVDPATLAVPPGSSDADCHFYPDAQQPQAAASLTSYDGVRSVGHLCEGRGGGSFEGLRHNREAPVPQNRLCRGRSARDVMRSCQAGDFARLPRPPSMMATPQLPAPQIDLVLAQPHARLVVVLDVSGSVPINLQNAMKSTAEMLITLLLEDGISCGLVTFGQSASVMKPMEKLDSWRARREFADTVRSLKQQPQVTSDGAAAVGEALTVAMELLGVNPESPSPGDSGRILLIAASAPGGHGRRSLEWASSVAKETSVAMDALLAGAYPQRAAGQLADLAAATGGSVFAGGSAGELLEAAAAAVLQRGAAVDAAFSLMSTNLPAASAEATVVWVHLDPPVVRDAAFVLSSRDVASGAKDLSVTSPSGIVYGGEASARLPGADDAEADGPPVYLRDAELGTVQIRLAGRNEPGKYTMTISGSAETDSTLTVVAKPAAALVSASAGGHSSLAVAPAVPSVPMILEGSVLGPRDVHLDADTRVAVTAQLRRGEVAVRGARIFARVRRPQADWNDTSANSFAMLQLLDNGAEPDAQAKDGVHSAYLPLSQLSQFPHQLFSIDVVSEWPVNRVASAGTIRVASVDSRSLLNAPPATVRDLRVSVDLTRQSLRLTWTAVGDQLNVGTASAYDIRTSASFDSLLDSFSSADRLPDGSPRALPLPAGSEQSLTLSKAQLAPYASTFYIAVRAVNSRGIAAQVSNVVSTQFHLPANVDGVGNVDGRIIDSLTTDSSSITATASAETENSTGATTAAETENSTGATTAAETENSTGATTAAETENSTSSHSADPTSPKASTEATEDGPTATIAIAVAAAVTAAVLLVTIGVAVALCIRRRNSRTGSLSYSSHM